MDHESGCFLRRDDVLIVEVIYLIVGTPLLGFKDILMNGFKMDIIGYLVDFKIVLDIFI